MVTIVPSTDSNRASATGQLSAVRKRFGDKEHVLLKVAETVSELAPSIEVVGCVDCATDGASLLLSLIPHGEVLGEGSSALNGRLVHTLGGVKAVVSAVRGEVSAQCPDLAGGKHVPRLYNVVFNKRVAGPPVEGEVARAFGVVCPRVLYGPLQSPYQRTCMSTKVIDLLAACAPASACHHAATGLTIP
jgi:hypothetical protein